jgi:hypothetical protein
LLAILSALETTFLFLTNTFWVLIALHVITIAYW